MCTALVTGTTGFIGCHVLDALQRHYDVVEMNRRERHNAKSHITWDFCSDLPSDVPLKLDLLVHCASAVASEDEAQAKRYFEPNVVGTKQLLSYARAAGAETFVYLSTGSIYGMCNRPCRETDTPTPLDAYASSKADAESIVAAYSSYLRVLTLRLFYPYGPRQQSPKLIPRLVQHIDEGRCVTLNGPAGYPLINPLYIEDLVNWLIVLLDRQATGVFNLAGSETVSIRQLAERLSVLLGRTLHFSFSSAPVGHRIGDIKRVCDTTGLLPAWDLQKGLGEVVSHYKYCAERLGL
jgi:nucleoside-diphosphate-sugar epimerase